MLGKTVLGALSSERLARLLAESGYNLSSPAEREIVRCIKETMGYVAHSYEQELHAAANGDPPRRSYELPDGQVLYVGDERFRCTEGLFQPDLLGKHVMGIHEAVYDSIMKCDDRMHAKPVTIGSGAADGGARRSRGRPLARALSAVDLGAPPRRS